MNRRVPQSTIDKLFGKKFYFQGNWYLPESLPQKDVPEYIIKALRPLKTRLNKTKSKLDGCDIELWAANTREQNPALKVKPNVKIEFNGEFVTQAWCKFYECLSQYPIISGSKLNSVHVCEAPGAFMSAINHFLETNYNHIEWKWCASSLNPYYEGNDIEQMIIDDRLMLHTMKNWCFGKDFTGNIMNIDNIKYIVEESQKMGRIDLVTADGSIDCMSNPEEQENTIFPLIYAEICAALRLLSNGGNFVLKMFTIFESTTVSLLYLLNCVFRKVSIFKPVTSKPGNSEVYVICLKFVKRSCPQALLDSMLNKVGGHTIHPLFPYKVLPNDFLKQVEKCARIFVDAQSKAIVNNIYSFETGHYPYGVPTKNLQAAVSFNYINRYGLKRLSDDQKIVPNTEIAKWCRCGKSIYTGSHSDRMKMQFIENNYIKGQFYLQEIDEIKVHLSTLEEFQKIHLEYLSNGIEICHGKFIPFIKSSLFIDINVIRLINRCRKLTSTSTGIYACLNLSIPWFGIFELNEFFKTENFSEFEKLSFRSICDLILQYGLPETIQMMKIPILTHFSSSFIYYLSSKVYETLESLPGYILRLEKVRKDGLQNFLLLYEQIFKQHETQNNILSFIPFKKLHENNYHSLIMNHNNRICLEYLEQFLNHIQES